ncbi:YbgA family protein [Colwelliaceae bacterium 6471]
MITTPAKIKIGISSCLLGEKVRFDGGHKKNSYINNVLAQYFDFTPFCPEMSIGLGVPRQTIRLVIRNDELRCIGNKDEDLDVTEKLYQSAEDQRHWHTDLSGYILKKDSPSCGMERVRVYKKDMPERNGSGLYAKRLMENFPHLPVEEEGRLGDAILRENFIQRVFIYYRWQQLMQSKPQWKNITEFHAQHKYIFMSHNQNKARALGKLLADNTKLNLSELCELYLTDMMTLLKIRATRKNHVNTLMHIQGYLKNYLSSSDKQELSDTMEQYRLGFLPLIVPITLLKHHFMHHPQQYILDSYYLQPHPSELMLLNSL